MKLSACFERLGNGLRPKVEVWQPAQYPVLGIYDIKLLGIGFTKTVNIAADKTGR